MKSILIVLILMLSINVFSQVSYTSKIPSGYQIKDVNNTISAKNTNDFDNDGKKDLAIIYTKSDFKGAILVIYLSTLFGKDTLYQYCEWFHMINDFTFSNGVLKLSSIDMGRYYFEIDLKYDAVSKKMKIIKYDENGVDKLSSIELKTGK